MRILKNSAMKLHEVKLTAENSYKEAIASKEKTVETFDGIHKDVAEAVETSKSVNKIEKLTENILNIATQTNLLTPMHRLKQQNRKQARALPLLQMKSDSLQIVRETATIFRKSVEKLLRQ